MIIMCLKIRELESSNLIALLLGATSPNIDISRNVGGPDGFPYLLPSQANNSNLHRVPSHGGRRDSPSSILWTHCSPCYSGLAPLYFFLRCFFLFYFKPLTDFKPPYMGWRVRIFATGFRDGSTGYRVIPPSPRHISLRVSPSNISQQNF